MALGIDTA